MKKFISLIVLTFVAVLFSACAKQPNEELLYNAKLYDKAENLLTNDYLENNQTHYPSADDDLPEYRCRLINNSDEYNAVFTSFPENIDFSQDILVVYQFTDIYYGFDCKIQSITDNESKITIKILHELAEKDNSGVRPPSTSSPTHRCLVIKLSDCDYENIKVEINYP